MHILSNNEISRKILTKLNERHPQAVKFIDMVAALNIDEKALFRNLFFLEENALVQLMSSYPTGATYPTIHMVKIREEGKKIAVDEKKLDALFPLKGASSRLDIQKVNRIPLSEIMDILSALVLSGKIDVVEERKKLFKELRELSEEPTLSKFTLGNILEHFLSKTT